MSAEASPDKSKVLVQRITDAQDFKECFACLAGSFGHQASDEIWKTTNPGWDTEQGSAACAETMIERWKQGNDAHTIHLKAIVQDEQTLDGHHIAGYAVWTQLSPDTRFGEKPQDWKPDHFQDLYPTDESERRFLAQMFTSLQRDRKKVVEEKASSNPPAVMALDICGVHPRYQKRGIASKLVQWGLDEAQSRGGLECITEGSSMGRHVYAKLGFQPQGPEVVYDVDPVYLNRPKPSNLFMRTGAR